jgi:hypothetical protein
MIILNFIEFFTHKSFSRLVGCSFNLLISDDFFNLVDEVPDVLLLERLLFLLFDLH